MYRTRRRKKGGFFVMRIEYKRRASCVRLSILIPVFLSVIFSIGFIRSAKAIEAASINSVSMSSNGSCVAGDPTGFLVHYTVDPDTNDVINSDTQTLYLLDGNNVVLGSRNLDIFRWNGNAVNLSTVLFTKANPTKGPFKLLIHDNASLSADFTDGSTFSAPSSKIITQQILDAHGSDEDCPAVVVTTNTDNNTNENTENNDNSENTQNTESSEIEQQQSTLTPDIINQQTSSFIAGVSENVGSLFSGVGTDPVFNPTYFTSNSSQFSGNFSLQSTGLKRWARAKKLEMASKKADKIHNTYGLRQATNTAEKENRLEAVHAGDDISDEDMAGTYNWWIKGSGTFFNGDGYSYKGTQFDIVSGIDYRASEDVIVGLLMGYGLTDFDFNNNGTDGKFDADGLSVGPYLGFQFSKYLYAEALLVYTRSDYENRSGATTGQYNADRITGVVNLRGRYEVGGGAIIEPGIGFLYAHEKQEAYTDNGGTSHASLTVKAGRVSVGPKVILAPVKLDSSKLTPWFAIKSEYDFSNQERAASSSLPDLSSFYSLRAQIGLDTLFDNGSKLSLKGDMSGLASNKYIGLGGQIRYDMAF